MAKRVADSEYTRQALPKVLEAIKHMTPDEVASRCNVSSATIYNWRFRARHGNWVYPHFRTLLEVARAAGFTIELVPPKKTHKVSDRVRVFP